MHAIQTAGLTHRFSSDVVLRGVDLAVPAGSLYGFLGPNGAGKTTTRMDGHRAVFPALSRDEAGRLSAALVGGGVQIYEITTVRRDLERIFLDLVGGDA